MEGSAKRLSSSNRLLGCLPKTSMMMMMEPRISRENQFETFFFFFFERSLGAHAKLVSSRDCLKSFN